MGPDPMKNMVATTYAGLEALLAAELKSLGADAVEIGRRMVSFRGDKALMYKANYCSRFALRILMEVHAFSIRDQEGFYSAVRAIPWENFLSTRNTLAVQAVTSGDILTHSKYAAQLTKDAVTDRFMERQQERPSVDLERPDLLINVHVRQGECHVSLDSSGESLHKRGWRKEQGEAPLSEVMAAALVALSGWTGEGEFLDPMCGSGTLPIEAAMIALNIPAGRFRRFFGFYKWKDFDRELWNGIKAEAHTQQRDGAALLIRGCDASWKAVAAAEANVRQAGLEEWVRIEKKPFQAVFPRRPSGVIVTNPPYDERIRSHDNLTLYHHFGDVLKQRFRGYTAWVFSGDLKAIKNVGLRPMGKHVLFNGPIECRYVRFELFGGALEDQRQRNSDQHE